MSDKDTKAPSGKSAGRGRMNRLFAKPSGLENLVLGNWAAAVALAALITFIFSNVIFGGWTFVGDSDRLNAFLNLRLLETDGIDAEGGAPLWHDGMFMGVSLSGLHFMVLGIDPIAYLQSLAPRDDLFRLMSLWAVVVLFGTAWAAFLFIKDVCQSAPAAIAGATVYAFSTYALHRLAQLDYSFLLLVYLPIVMLLIRQLAHHNAARTFVLLTTLSAASIWMTFLQEIAYIALFLSGYAVYRSVVTRSLLPMVVFGVSYALAILIGAPRLAAVLIDVSSLARTDTFHSTAWIEVLRFFSETIFGRYQGEGRAIGNGTNLHEGLQLVGTTTAAILALLVIFSLRTALGRLAAVLTGAVLLLAGPALFPDVYGLFRLQVLPSPISATANDVFIQAILLGAIVTMWNLARNGWRVDVGPRARILVEHIKARTQPVVQRLTAAIPDTVTARASVLFSRPATRPNQAKCSVVPPKQMIDSDCLFFALVTGAVLSVVLVPEARYMLHLAFFEMDFTHSRFSIAALLPISTLCAVALVWIAGPSQQTSRIPLAAAVMVVLAGFAFAVVVESRFLASLAETLFGGPTFPVSWNFGLSLEMLRIAIWLLMACAIWALVARHATELRHLRVLLAVFLGSAVIGEATLYGREKVFGQHTLAHTVPFEDNNYMNVAPGLLRPPGAPALQAIRDRLEVDDYRAILIQDAQSFPAFAAPHISTFWQLRLLDGYSAGVPEHLAALPWPGTTNSLRALTFREPANIPWGLLALLNVKYALVLEQDFFFNAMQDIASVEVLANPLAVTPRAFFSKSLHPGYLPLDGRISADAPPLITSIKSPYPGAVYMNWRTAPLNSKTFEIRWREEVVAEEQAWRYSNKIGPSSREFLFTELPEGESLSFEIRACDDSTCTPFSSKSDVTTATSLLPAPIGATVTASDAKLSISWTDQGLDADLVVEVFSVDEPTRITTAAARDQQAQLTLPQATVEPVAKVLVRYCDAQSCGPHIEANLSGLSKGAPVAAQAQAPALATSLEARSYSYAIKGVQTYGNSAHPNVTFGADFIEASFEPSDQHRLLVLNELYHPMWTATAGDQSLNVLPVNDVMRGIEIPPGVDYVEIRFNPNVVLQPMFLFAAFGLLAALGLAVFLAIFRPLLSHLDFPK